MLNYKSRTSSKCTDNLLRKQKSTIYISVKIARQKEIIEFLLEICRFHITVELPACHVDKRAETVNQNNNNI